MGQERLFLETGSIDPRIRRAIELIESDLKANVPLGEITAELGLSPSHFSHLFKEATGTSYRAYRKRHRLRKAAILLSDWNLRVSEIARSVGYGDPSNFARDFKDMYDASPSRFRRMKGNA